MWRWCSQPAPWSQLSNTHFINSTFLARLILHSCAVWCQWIAVRDKQTKGIRYENRSSRDKNSKTAGAACDQHDSTLALFSCSGLTWCTFCVWRSPGRGRWWARWRCRHSRTAPAASASCWCRRPDAGPADQPPSSANWHTPDDTQLSVRVPADTYLYSKVWVPDDTNQGWKNPADIVFVPPSGLNWFMPTLIYASRWF